MVTSIRETRELLLNALRKYHWADSEAEVELAVLALHKAVEEAMGTYLQRHGDYRGDHPEVDFRELADVIRDQTDLFEGDPRLPAVLASLNETWVRIANPGQDKPTAEEISQAADELAGVIRRLWRRLFGEAYPGSLVAPLSTPELQGKETFAGAPATHSDAEYRKGRVPARVGGVLRGLWKDDSQPRFEGKVFVGRVVRAVILFTLATWCKDLAISTVRWPTPIKYGGVVLFVVAVGLFLWGSVMAWRVLRQLRIKGLLIALGVSYVLLISMSLLTSNSALPLHREALLATRRLLVEMGAKVREVGQAMVKAPEEFRFAYTGHRRPVLLPGMSSDDPSYLTPVAANLDAQALLGGTPVTTPSRGPVGTERATTIPPISTVPATQAQERPTFLPLQLPDCPHPQAQLMVPRMNQVISDEVRVEGTADIENFDYYKFEIRREDGEVEDEWHCVEIFSTPVKEGVLGVWQVSHLPIGTYTFRLTVVNREGNYPFPPCDVRVQIVH